MGLLGRLRKAVKKLTFLMNLKNFLNQATWRIASAVRGRPTATITGGRHWQRRAVSFNHRPGLTGFVELDDQDDENDRRSDGSRGTTSPHQLQRTMSYPLEEDVDKRAAKFIATFYRHLNYERKISLELSYCRGNSFSSLSGDSSNISPLSSAGSPT